MLDAWSEGTECHWCGRAVHLHWELAGILDLNPSSTKVEEASQSMSRRGYAREDLVDFVKRLTDGGLGPSDDHGRGYSAFFSKCPSPDCGRVMIGFAHHYGGSHGGHGRPVSRPSSFTVLWPKTTQPAPMPDVPSEMFGKYAEATAVLGISPDASAALTRRIVEQVLNEQDFKQDTLAGKIAAFRESDSPRRLKESIDYLRTLGNWAVHPPSWQAAGEIVAVREGEAEWALDLVRDLFQYFYVEPAEDERRRNAIDAKRPAKNAE